MRVGLLTLVVTIGLTGLEARAIAEEASSMAPTGALDGKVFVGTMGKEGEAAGDTAEFIFEDGTFRSTAGDAYGFGAAPYIFVVGAEGVTFDVKTESRTDGTIVWEGMVRGDTIEGIAVWQKADGQAPDALWFEGSLKP